MARDGKDAREVVLFRQLFADLRNWMDDDPADLRRAADQDDSIDELCRRLNWAAFFLQDAQDARPQLFSAPADPAFIADWRDYEKRWKEAVGDVAFGDLLADIVARLPETTAAPSAPRPTPAQERWDYADARAEAEAAALGEALSFAEEQVSQDWREFDEDFVELVQDGLDQWRRLKANLGFDPRGVFRRRRLIPFVLVPRSIAASYGESDKVSLLTNLRAAHDAFVFGAPLAALAMMRSILEGVLRDHYRAAGKDLSARINNASRLPQGAPKEALHRLRSRANALLHLNRDTAAALPVLGAEDLEREIVSLLVVLRTLIEEAPDTANRGARRT